MASRKLQSLILLSAGLVILLLLVFSELIANWLDGFAFLKVLDSLSKLGVLIAVVAFLWEMPKREERAQLEKRKAHFDYWKALDMAALTASSNPSVVDTSTSYARKIALENLAQDGVSLRNIDAPYSDLSRINLTGAELVGANLEGADLRESKLREANLCKADLGKARLYGADLKHAQLDSADLRGALYDHKTLFSTDFDADKAGAHLIAPGSNLSSLDLSRSVMWGADLHNAILEETNLTDAALQGANLEGARLKRANFESAKFWQATLARADLTDANLRNADFRGAKGLEPQQIRSASNWKLARYDDEFRVLLEVKAPL